MANGFPVNISRQAGGPVSSSDINALAAAVNESAPAKVTAAGQIPVGAGVNELLALAAPLVSGLSLVSDMAEPGKVKWGAGLIGAIVSAAAQNTNSIVFNTKVLDTSGFVDLGANNNRITIPAGFGGIYLLLGYVAFAYSAATQDWDRNLYIAPTTGTGSAPAFSLPAMASHQAIHAGTSGFDNQPTVFPAIGFASLTPGNYITMSTLASNDEVSVSRSGWMALVRLFDLATEAS